MNDQHPNLCDALRALIAAFEGELISATPITRIPSTLSARASFILRFADGRVLKGRRVHSARRCAILAALAPVLRGLPLTRIVSHRENALLEEWVQGTPFAQYDADSLPSRLEEAGALLGRMNQLRGWPAIADRRQATPESLLRRTADRLANLARGGALSPETAEQLHALAQQNRPQKLEIGLIHHDFCADNLIVTRDEEIFAVDNEDMCIGILDADLARACCRWPMTDDQRQRFYAGYRRHRNIESFLHHATFWSIWTLSGSALFRARRRQPHSDLVDCLQRLKDGDEPALWPGAA